MVQYQVDEKWYRARVRSILPSCKKTNEELVDVVYVDYGNTEIIPSKKWAQHIHWYFSIYLAEMWVEFFIGCLTILVEQTVYAATHNACCSREDVRHTVTWYFSAGLCSLLKVWNFDSSLCHVLEFFWFDHSDTKCLSLITDVDCLQAKCKMDPGVDLRIFCGW